MRSTPFLKEIASILLQPGAYDLPATCVVFPNKRARLYLSKYIGELTDKPVWAPRYLTISELMEKISGYLFVDKLTLLFELFDVYTKTTGSNENFDSFYPYSETLLADFDEIDKYMVNASDLFGNLAGLKSIDGRFNYLSDDQIALIRRFWSTFNPERISEGQEVFISLWEALPVVYHELKSRLQNRKMAYEGMAYRQAIENIGDGNELNIPEFQKFLFVGFNALNTCEEKLFMYLKNLNRAEFFWDYDNWYANNDIHEAGFFIRKNLRNFPQTKPVNHENLVTNNKSVLFIPVSSNSGQAGILPQVFNRFGIHNSNNVEHTALVLADENLLISTLYAIPGYISGVNITMGYPLAGSSVFNLIDCLYELIRNSRNGGAGKTMWYFRDVLAIMGNPMLKTCYPDKGEHVRQKVILHNMVYLKEEDILHEQSEDLIFNDRLQKENVCQYLLNITANIISQLPALDEKSGSPDPVHLETLFQVYTFLTRLKDTLALQSFVPGTDILFKLIRKMMRSMHIPFSGEPLAGLQILGILETRTLDFENVILLSANEGILPKSADTPSFIPYNLRAGFGLPTPEHHDSIYAYYFYRLIQRAQNIALVYDSSSGGLRTGERSRFLHQLYYETSLPVTEIIFESSIAQLPVKPIIIEKTYDVAIALGYYTGNEGKLLSPSAINEFLSCPLKFYFHHIAGLPQPDEVTEEIDARMFGNLLHSALKLIYSGFNQSLITRERLEVALKDEGVIDAALDKAFSEALFGDTAGTGNRKPEGFNLIVRQVIHTYIRQFIRTELDSCPFNIVSLEERYMITIPVTGHENISDINIGGIIDRIDIQDGKTRILDYKTGAVKNSFTNVESLFDAGEKIRNDAAFQVLLYAFVYDKLNPGNIIVPGLYFLRNSHTEDFSCSLRFGSKKEALSNFTVVQQEFEALLQKNLSRLFDFREPFTQTANLQVCQYCSYAAICRRENNEAI
jgi:hypothetical protein